jgi:probable HAF family extracellular repeat protein
MIRFFPARYYCAVVFASMLPSSPSHAAGYSVTDLGVLGDPYLGSVGLSLNSNGFVAGYSYYDESISPGQGQTDAHAFLYDGALHDLNTLGGDSSFAAAVNDNGVVVGYSHTPASVLHAFLYDGTMHDFGTLGGRESGAAGINISNQVAGWSDMPDGTEHAFVYDGSMHDLGTLSGSNSAATGINNSGLVVGTADSPTGFEFHAFLYDGTMHDLGTLGGGSSFGTAINAIGHVVGNSDLPYPDSTHAFFYDGVMHDLGDLGGGASWAQAINASDAITGQSKTSDGGFHAFLYTPQGGMVELNSLIDPLSGWDLAIGSSINDAGQVTGWGFIDGQTHAFLLTPVPEPHAISLAFLAALYMLFTFRRVRESGSKSMLIADRK